MAKNLRKILVVDDNKTIVMYVSVVLKRMGFEVIPSGNGLEALKLVQLTDPDLIMLDITMPVMDGLTALRMLKEDKSTSSIPVVMLSIDADQELIDQCEQLGSSGYLTKPLQVDHLHELLQDCLLQSTGFKRKHLRSPYHEKVAVKHRGETLTLYAESISEGGMFIRKRDPFEVGSKVEVMFPLVDIGTFCLKATVIYIKDRISDLYRTPLGMAVKFEDLTPDDAPKLNMLLKELLARDIWESQEETVIKPESREETEKDK